MLIRSIRASRCSGASATISCMVEQLGLAMIPRGRWRTISGLTSLTTSGTSSSPRKAEELSITTAPAAANLGAYSRDTSPPAENRRDVDPGRVERGEVADHQLVVAELHALARRTPSLASATSSPTGNAALGQDRQHRLADRAGGAHDRDLQRLAHRFGYP
jgi:hypothetical protein